VGGVEDHVHLLSRLSSTVAIADLIRELKRDSSRWIKTQEKSVSTFYWQSGYAAFSISPSHVDALTQYIQDQEEHHRKETFQDELRRLAIKYDLPLDERYAWE